VGFYIAPLQGLITVKGFSLFPFENCDDSTGVRRSHTSLVTYIYMHNDDDILYYADTVAIAAVAWIKRPDYNIYTRRS